VCCDFGSDANAIVQCPASGQSRGTTSVAQDAAGCAFQLPRPDRCQDFGTGPRRGKAASPFIGRNERNGLNAASNVKLVTTAAALAFAGARVPLEDGCSGPGARRGWALPSVPPANCRAISFYGASGDPTLTAQDLAELSSELSAIGLRRVHGACGRPPRPLTAPRWGRRTTKKDDSAAFRAPSSAASLNGNAVAVIITSGPSAGAQARVVLDPPSANVVLTGRVDHRKQGTGRAHRANQRRRQRPNPRDCLGPHSSGQRAARGAAPDRPADLFLGQTFQTDPAETRYHHRPAACAWLLLPRMGCAPWPRHELAYPWPWWCTSWASARTTSSPRQVLRTLGRRGHGEARNMAEGADAVARYSEGLGIPKTSFHHAQRLGLYDSNRFSAEQMATVIRAAMPTSASSGEYLASLP